MSSWVILKVTLFAQEWISVKIISNDIAVVIVRMTPLSIFLKIESPLPSEAKTTNTITVKNIKGTNLLIYFFKFNSEPMTIMLPMITA